MTNRCSLWRVLHIQIKAPRRFHIGVFPEHTRPAGQANSTDAEARRVQHPGTVHVRETSATRSLGRLLGGSLVSLKMKCLLSIPHIVAVSALPASQAAPLCVSPEHGRYRRG
jgi:hypothetical protein